MFPFNASDIVHVNFLIEIAAKDLLDTNANERFYSHLFLLHTIVPVLQPNSCLPNKTVSQVYSTNTTDNTDNGWCDHKSVSRSHVTQMHFGIISGQHWMINAWIMGILIKNASIMWKYEIIGQQIKWEKFFFSDVSCTHGRTCVYGRYAPGLLLAEVCYSLWFYMWRIPYYNLSCHNLTNDDLMFVH